jgi:hypothetical protein
LKVVGVLARFQRPLNGACLSEKKKANKVASFILRIQLFDFNIPYLWSELKVKIAMNQKIVLEEIPIDYNASRG